MAYGNDLTMYVPKSKVSDKKENGNKSGTAPRKDIFVDGYVPYTDLGVYYTIFYYPAEPAE